MEPNCNPMDVEALRDIWCCLLQKAFFCDGTSFKLISRTLHTVYFNLQRNFRKVLKISLTSVANYSEKLLNNSLQTNCFLN